MLVRKPFSEFSLPKNVRLAYSIKLKHSTGKFVFFFFEHSTIALIEFDLFLWFYTVCWYWSSALYGSLLNIDLLPVLPVCQTVRCSLEFSLQTEFLLQIVLLSSAFKTVPVV